MCYKIKNMKRTLLIGLQMLLTAQLLFAQANLKVNEINMNNQRKLAKQLKPLINTMGSKRIVGLGEGTHGTKEFNDIRIAIMKELTEKKGFSIIVFENPYGDSYYLNKAINSDADIKVALKSYVTSIWQTREMEGLLLWIRDFNRTHKHHVEFMGMDYNFIGNAAKIIKDELGGDAALAQKIDTLYRYAYMQDTLWAQQNDTTVNIDWRAALKRGVAAYKAVLAIDSMAKQQGITVSSEAQLALLNCKHGFDAFYYSTLQKDGTPRDECMAQIVSLVAAQNPAAKITVWAHAAHTAVHQIFKDDNGGGMGMYIKKEFGNQYFVLGTTTASGTYSAMTDGIDTRDNTFKSYTLTKTVENSWEYLFAKNKAQAFYMPLANSNFSQKLKWRALGYNPEGPNGAWADEVLISDLFDAIVFIRNTNASNHNL